MLLTQLRSKLDQSQIPSQRVYKAQLFHFQFKSMTFWDRFVKWFLYTHSYLIHQ